MNGADKQAAPPSLDSPEVGEESALMEAGLLSPGEDGYGAVTPPDESIDAKEKRGKKAKKAVVDLLKMYVFYPCSARMLLPLILT